MSSLIKTTKSIPPVKLTWRARLLIGYGRWRGPVTAAKDGVVVARHRRELRTGARVISVAAAVVAAGSIAAAVKRQAAAKGTISPAT